MKAEVNFLQVEYSSQIVRDRKVCGTIGPVDSALAKMHEAEVHVFSDSVVGLGKTSAEHARSQIQQKVG